MLPQTLIPSKLLFNVTECVAGDFVLRMWRVWELWNTWLSYICHVTSYVSIFLNSTLLSLLFVNDWWHGKKLLRHQCTLTIVADLTVARLCLLSQYLRGPRRAAQHLPGRGATHPGGGYNRGDPKELLLFLLLHDSLLCQQSPHWQRWVRLGPQLFINFHLSVDLGAQYTYYNTRGSTWWWIIQHKHILARKWQLRCVCLFWNCPNTVTRLRTIFTPLHSTQLQVR